MKCFRKKVMAVIMAMILAIGMVQYWQPEQVVYAASADIWDGYSIATAFAGGTGQQADPYQIATAAQLAYLAKVCNDSPGNWYHNAYYILTSDIDLNYKLWTPICSSDTSLLGYFKGGFDGNNHKIMNMKIDESCGSGKNQGLFGQAAAYYIRNLTLENVDVAGKATTDYNTSTGALIGRMATNSGNSITGITVTGTIHAAYSNTGGVIGSLWPTGNNSTLYISSCINKATIIGQENVGDCIVGGIVGGIAPSMGGKNKKVVFTSCINEGTIIGDRRVGGIVGIDDVATTFDRCMNSGQIKANMEFGGIVGLYSYATIQNCLNTGELVSTSGNTAYTGGIAGSFNNAFGGDGVIEYCLNLSTSAGAGIVGQEQSSSKIAYEAVRNCFYVSGKCTNFTSLPPNMESNELVDAATLRSGKITYLLNKEISAPGPQYWYQILGTDATPHLKSSNSGLVFMDGNCPAISVYSNDTKYMFDKNPEHNHQLVFHKRVEPLCGVDGVDAYYECKNCARIFSNEAGTRRITLEELALDSTGIHVGFDANGICTNCGGYQMPEKNESDVYVINNLGNFLYFADGIVNEYELKNPDSIGMSFAEPTKASDSAILMTDIDLSGIYNANGKSWFPLGGNNFFYSGEFNGNGHTISGLYINSNTVTYAGLFGRLSYGVGYVHDLTLENVSITAPNATSAGAIAGYMYSRTKAPTIERCVVKNGTIQGKNNVGGIVGYVTAGSGYNAVEVVLDESYVMDPSEQIYVSSVINCGNNATVKGTSNVGGIVGYGTVYVNKTYNAATVSGQNAGSIAGNLQTKSVVSNSYYTGSDAVGVNATSADNINNNQQKTTTQFASGEVTYLLNGSSSENVIWRQNLTGNNADAAPMLLASHGVVYEKNGTYSNTEPVNCAHDKKKYVSLGAGSKKHSIICETCQTILGEEDCAGSAVKSNVIAATCVANEKYDEVTTCSLCKTLISSVPKETANTKLGHQYADQYLWTNDGTGCKLILTCNRSDCTSSTQGHSLQYDCTISSKVKVAATCKTKGTTTYTAKYTYNGKEYTSTKDIQDIAILRHKFETYTSDKNASCTADGTKTAMCAYGCGTKDTIVDTGSKLGHNYVNNVCTRCGDVLQIDEETKIKAFVTRLYTKMLNREAEEDGVRFWTEAIRSGRSSCAEAVEGFAISKELENSGISNEELVQRVFKTMLDREADEDGLAYWKWYLDIGCSISKVVDGFAVSEEFNGICAEYGMEAGRVNLKNPRDINSQITLFVGRCFTEVLNRPFDIKGLDYWADEILSGRSSCAEAVEQFATSSEIKNSGISDEVLIQRLFKTMLNREADADGLAYWKWHLDIGCSVSKIIDGFATSDEFKAICAGYGMETGSISLENARDINPKVTNFVGRCYREVLERSYDYAGLDYWCALINSKEKTPVDLVRGLIESNEVQEKNLSDEQYLRILYKAFLGREADQDGLNYWHEKMSNGASRAEALEEFSRAKEFVDILAGFGL